MSYNVTEFVSKFMLLKIAVTKLPLGPLTRLVNYGVQRQENVTIPSGATQQK